MIFTVSGRPQVQKAAVSAMVKPSAPLSNTVAILKDRDSFHQEEEDLTRYCSGSFVKI